MSTQAHFFFSTAFLVGDLLRSWSMNNFLDDFHLHQVEVAVVQLLVAALSGTSLSCSMEVTQTAVVTAVLLSMHTVGL